MSIHKTNKASFCESLATLQEEVFAYDFSRKVVYTESSAALCEYFHLYGFDKSELNLNADYRIGTLNFNKLRLLAHWWQLGNGKDALAAKGTICLVPGLFDHVGLYLKMAQFLLAEGYSVFAIDMPGHGLSEGPRAEIENFSDYAEVLEKSLEKILAKNPNENILMLGQSTGAAAVAHYLMTGAQTTRIKKAILLAPLLRPVRYWYANLAWLLAHKLFTTVPRRFAVNSNDQDFLEFIEKKDPLQALSISVKWVAAMRAWNKTFPAFVACDIPVLILQGDDDGTVDWKYNIPVFKKQFPNNKTVMLAGAKHHLVNEVANHFQKMHSEINDFLK